MFRNNLKIAWRNVLRHKLYSLLNVLGLGFGIACFLFIALYVIDELTFDRFHQKSDRIYRLVQHRESPEEGVQKFGAVSYNAGVAAREEIAGVESSTHLFMFGRAVLRNPANQNAFYQPFLTAEPTFFDLFDFAFISGDPSTALAEPNTVVLEQDLAQRLFGDLDPMGQILRSDRGMDLEVTGVLKDLPSNSHIQFESLISQATLEAVPFWERNMPGDWSSQNFGTYLALHPDQEPATIGAQLTDFARARAREERPFTGHLELQPLTDIHFGSEGYQRELNEQKSTYTYLYIFSLIGLFIVLIACVNYVNLATARSSKYSREVGVRKVVGAGRRQLFARFLSESVVLTLLAFFLAVALTQAGLPLFNEFTGKALTLNLFASGWTIPTMAAIIFLVSLLAGSYPSIYLSRFRPSVVLKGVQNTEKGKHGLLRRGLVVLQFSISILMIIGTLVAWRQVSFVMHRDLGFAQDQRIVVDINSGRVRQGFETIKHGYEQLPDVRSVSVSSRVPGEWKTLLQAEIRPEGKFAETGPTPWFIGADEDFLETFEIDLISGRNFDPQRPMDSASIILNQQAAAVLGIDAAAGQSVQVVSRIANGSERMFDEPFRAQVIGIMEDFNFQSLYEPVTPLVLAYRSNPVQAIDYFTAHVSGQNTERTIQQMTEILHSVDPEQLFEYHFLDEQIDQFYEADVQRSQLFSTAALCAIFIACLGLFGLAAFMAEQRTKEIGIRKVLGSSTVGIVQLLSKDFIKLVLIALLVASPLAYHFMEQWLQGFAYRISIAWWMFAVAGAFAATIALVTVGYHSIRAATSNPAEALRSE